jgi:hypothetical protein
MPTDPPQLRNSGSTSEALRVLPKRSAEIPRTVCRSLQGVDQAVSFPRVIGGVSEGTNSGIHDGAIMRLSLARSSGCDGSSEVFVVAGRHCETAVESHRGWSTPITSEASPRATVRRPDRRSPCK